MKVIETTEPERTFTLEVTEAELLQILGAVAVALPARKNEWLYSVTGTVQDRLPSNRISDHLYDGLREVLGLTHERYVINVRPRSVISEYDSELERLLAED